MKIQEHERAELYEDCDDLAKRLHGAANRIEKIGDINGAIMKRMDLENIRLHEDLRRLRIAHLRRMVCSIPGAIERTQWFPTYTEQEFEHKKWRRRDRFTRFAKACNAEIARLRGEG